MTLFFEIYFNKVVAPNKSIIENLDIDFSVNSESESWSDYKYDFSNNCNNVAWEIVKKPTNNTSELRKAIKWSETSIEIQKDKHYLYDTLGQLYYLNNQKDKAIATQQKAIDLDENSDNETVYKTVLDQMKNGTYTKPLE